MLLFAAESIDAEYAAHILTEDVRAPAQPAATADSAAQALPRTHRDKLLSRARVLLQQLDQLASRTSAWGGGIMNTQADADADVWKRLQSLTWCPVLQVAPQEGETQLQQGGVDCVKSLRSGS